MAHDPTLGETQKGTSDDSSTTARQDTIESRDRPTLAALHRPLSGEQEETTVASGSVARSTPHPSPGEQSLHFLYHEQFGPLYRFIYSKVGNRQEAEDLTSLVFLKAMQNMNTERSSAARRQWLFQVARTTIADHWRSWYRLPTTSLEVLLTGGWKGPAGVERPGPDRNPEERVMQILQALPERHREILTCRFLLALSVRDTARRMGLSEQNVKTLQFRALKRAAALETQPG